MLIIQQAGSTDVRIGGADVVASGAAGTTFLQAGQGDAVGLLLNALPSPQTSPPTAPTNLSIASSGEAIYGIVASGTSTVIVYEEF